MSDTVDTVEDSSPEEQAEKKKSGEASRKQIRSSSLFVIGRFIAIAANTVSQILIVRYLDKAEYGAFAYALSMVNLFETFVTFGLDRAITRFVPIYDEHEDYARMLGTITFVIATILTLSIGLLLIFFGLQAFISQKLITDEQVLLLLGILVFLGPIQAVNNLINGMFAVFSKPRAIFFRVYVFAPGFRMFLIFLVIVGNLSVTFLAYGYLAGGLIVTVVFGAWLLRTLQEAKLFKRVGIKELAFPIKEVLAFTVPLLASDVLYTIMGTIDVVMLERYADTEAVASLRAVASLARMNELVLATFAILYTPAAARMFAKKDTKGIDSLYWQNAVWSTVISFPIFLVTFSLASPVTILLFGERYASSAIIVATLSFGYYFDAALGQNGLTLKVMGKLRYITVIYLAAAVISVILNLIFIPLYGAFGAALGTAGTLIIFNLLKQGGLLLGTGISIFKLEYRGMYLSIVIATLTVLIVQVVLSTLLISPAPALMTLLPEHLRHEVMLQLTESTIEELYTFIIGFIVAVVVSLAVVRYNRKLLDAANMFPELMRIPVVRWILS